MLMRKNQRMSRNIELDEIIDISSPLPFERIRKQGTKASKAVSFKYQVPYDTCQKQIMDIWADNKEKIDYFTNSNSTTREKELYFFFLDRLKSINDIKQITTKDRNCWKYKSIIVVEDKFNSDMSDVRESLFKDIQGIYHDIHRCSIEHKKEGINQYVITINGTLSSVFTDIEEDDYENYIYQYVSQYATIIEQKTIVNKRIMYSPYVEFELNRVDWNDEDVQDIFDRKELFSQNRHLFDLTPSEELVIDMIFSGYNINSSPDDEIVLEALKAQNSTVNSVNYLKGAFMDRLIYKLKHNSPFRDDL